MLFATVTPSFVTFGAPKLCSRTTLRPYRSKHIIQLIGMQESTTTSKPKYYDNNKDY